MNAKRARRSGNVSASMLLRAKHGTPARLRSPSTSTVPSIWPATISSPRAAHAMISCACPGYSRASSWQDSRMGTPRSCARCHSPVQTRARKSVSSSGSSISFRYRCRGSQSRRTPPRSKTTVSTAREDAALAGTGPNLTQRGPRADRGYEPPDVTWPEPGLDDGAAPDFSPLEREDEPELPEAEPPEPESPEVPLCWPVPCDVAVEAAGWALAAVATATGGAPA